MKQKEVVNAREAIMKIYESSPGWMKGDRIVKLRRTLKKLQEIIDQYDDLLSVLLKDKGKKELKRGEPGYDEVLQKLEESLNMEVEIKIEKVLEEEDCLKIGLSLKEIEQIETLGLV